MKREIQNEMLKERKGKKYIHNEQEKTGKTKKNKRKKLIKEGNREKKMIETKKNIRK